MQYVGTALRKYNQNFMTNRNKQINFESQLADMTKQSKETNNCSSRKKNQLWINSSLTNS